MTGPTATPPAPVGGSWRCCWCRSADGVVVLDLGEQPAGDDFPHAAAPGPDAVHPLRMVQCRACGLAQLAEDPTGPEDPRGLEPRALVDQARAAVADLVAGGWAARGATVAEFPSPHGGSWLGLLGDAGLVPAGDGPADLVVDSLGLMHDADQRAALAARAARLAAGGLLALHVHPLSTILRDGTWNALRHGHHAYYSVPVLVAMAAQAGLVPVDLFRYPLYGGTVVLVLAREDAGPAARPGAERVAEEVAAETAAGVLDPSRVAALGRAATGSAAALARYLAEARDRGTVVAAYGAASRAGALLVRAGVTADDVRLVADASPAKHGLAMPGSRVPIVAPRELLALRPDRVLLFVTDLLDEVRRAYPEVEAAGARWVVLDPAPRELPPATLSGPASRGTPPTSALPGRAR